MASKGGGVIWDNVWDYLWFLWGHIPSFLEPIVVVFSFIKAISNVIVLPYAMISSLKMISSFSVIK